MRAFKFANIVLGTLCMFILSSCSPQQTQIEPTTTPSQTETGAATTASETVPVSSDLALGQSLTDAIIEHNKKNYRGGDAQLFETEYHEILEVVADTNQTEVYVSVVYAQYGYNSEGNLGLTGAVGHPCVITFEHVDGEYRVTEYWTPEDGEQYEKSICNRFPEELLVDGVSQLTASELNVMDILDQRAMDFFEVDELDGKAH